MKRYEHKHEKSSRATGRPRIIEVKRESPSDILLGDDRYSEERLCVSAIVTWRKCCRPSHATALFTQSARLLAAKKTKPARPAWRGPARPPRE